MGKSKGPRAKPRQDSPPQPPPQKPGPGKPENRFLRLWKLFWAVVGPLIAAGSAAANFTPDLSISTSVNVDPTQTFGTQFAVTNIGRIPVRDLSFSCGLRGREIHIGVLSLNPINIAGVNYLPAGATVTRSCFNESKDVLGADLEVQVHYRWPVLPTGGTKSVLFVPVRTTTGFVMVPSYQNN